LGGKSYTLELVNEAVIKIEAGQSILEASLAADVPHYHTCGGRAQCSTCRVLVISGMENLTPMNEFELSLRTRKKFADDIRLACQTKVTGDNVKLKRIIKDEEDLRLYVTGETAIAHQSLGEEKELALFFLNIRNFSSFMEMHLPFDVIHIIRRLAVLFTSVVNSYNGKIIESSGDGFYAVFGLNEEIEPAVQNAYNSSRKILGDLKQLNEKYIKKFFDHEIEVGIGIHSGKVMIGNTGYGGVGTIMAMGFPVVIAARLEEATKELNNNLIVSEHVFKFLKPEENNVVQKKIKLKGVSKAIEVRLLGEQYSYLK
jgi:adenylate cyclase